MGMGWDLIIVPASPSYAPGPETIARLLTFLADRVGVREGWSVDDGDETGVDAAAAALADSARSRSSSECQVYTDLGNSDVLFGWDGDADDPDRNFWADGLRVQITSAPKPYVDPEFDDDVLCPGCKASLLPEFADRLEEDFREPLHCGCGRSVPWADVKIKGRGRLAKLSVSFTGNKGWQADLRNPQKAFKDGSFLPALEKVLGSPLKLLLRST